MTTFLTSSFLVYIQKLSRAGLNKIKEGLLLFMLFAQFMIPFITKQHIICYL